jgi:hypothetical protein
MITAIECKALVYSSSAKGHHFSRMNLWKGGQRAATMQQCNVTRSRHPAGRASESARRARPTEARSPLPEETQGMAHHRARYQVEGWRSRTATLVVERTGQATMDSASSASPSAGVRRHRRHRPRRNLRPLRGRLTAPSGSSSIPGKVTGRSVTEDHHRGGELSGDVSALQPLPAISPPAGIQGDPAPADVMTPYDPLGRGKSRPLQAAKSP